MTITVRSPHRRAVLVGLTLLSQPLSGCGRALGSTDDADNWLDPVTAPDWRSDRQAKETYRELARHASDDGAAYSDDGNRIAYCRNLGPGRQIELIDLEAGSITRIEHTNPIIKLRDPCFSPDGGKLLLTGTPPFYGGISQVAEIDLATWDVRGLLDSADALYRWPVYRPDGQGVVVGVGRGPVETNDRRPIHNLAYRQAFFFQVAQIAADGQVELVSQVYLPGLRGLSVSSENLIGFCSGGWSTERDGIRTYLSLETRFPELSEDVSALVLTLPVRGADEPSLSDASVAASRLLQGRDLAANFKALLPDGRLVYATGSSDFSVQQLIYDGPTAELSAPANVGPDTARAANRTGALAIVSHKSDLPAVATISERGATTVLKSGALARQPTRQVSFDIPAPS